MWVSVLVQGRRGEQRTGDGLRAMDRTDAPGAHKSSSGLGSKGETRSLPPPHVLLGAQACQSATALRPISAQNPPDLKPIGTQLTQPRPLVPKRVASSRKR